uniref:Uncharacterized protein n=1 Tax=Tetranychus urticae TaxID=32264 RepID=T1JZ40_TETUR
MSISLNLKVFIKLQVNLNVEFIHFKTHIIPRNLSYIDICPKSVKILLIGSKTMTLKGSFYAWITLHRIPEEITT